MTDEMIQKKHWPPISQNLNPGCHVMEAMHVAFSKASSEAKYSFWIARRTA